MERKKKHQFNSRKEKTTEKVWSVESNKNMYLDENKSK
jgi:hypothetical protein